MVTAFALLGIMENIDMCTESELLEVKVPIVFLGTVGFCCSGNPGLCFASGMLFAATIWLSLHDSVIIGLKRP